MRTSVNSLAWTPEGRRCITGTQSGEFTLWNGTQFNFETIIQVGFRLNTFLTTAPLLVMMAHEEGGGGRARGSPGRERGKGACSSKQFALVS